MHAKKAAPMPAAWEYARLFYAFGKPETDRPEQGHVAFTHHKEGWELVTKTNFPADVSGEGEYEMYFKRPRDQ